MHLTAGPMGYPGAVALGSPGTARGLTMTALSLTFVKDFTTCRRLLCCVLKGSCKYQHSRTTWALQNSPASSRVSGFQYTGTDVSTAVPAQVLVGPGALHPHQLTRRVSGTLPPTGRGMRVTGRGWLQGQRLEQAQTVGLLSPQPHPAPEPRRHNRA